MEEHLEEEHLESRNEIDRQLALDDLRQWLNDMPETKRDEPFLAVGRQTFTPRQMLEAVEAQSALGAYFIEALGNLRSDLSQRGG